jgi:hypothetical protein
MIPKPYQRTDVLYELRCPYCDGGLRVNPSDDSTDGAGNGLRCTGCGKQWYFCSPNVTTAQRARYRRIKEDTA